MRVQFLRALRSGLLAGGGLLLAASALAGPEADIRYRQAVMKANGGHMMAIQAIVKGDVPHRGDLLAHAQALAASGDMMSRLFPVGSGAGRTRARPEIWTNAADFRLKLDEYRAASRALVSAAQGTDSAATGAAMARTGRACKGCHDRYEREE